MSFNASLCYTSSQQMFKMCPVCTHALSRCLHWLTAKSMMSCCSAHHARRRGDVASAHRRWCVIHTPAAAWRPRSCSRRDSAGLDCWAARGQDQWSQASLSLQQLDGITGLMCRSAVLLEDKHVACYLFDGRNHLLRQQDIVVVVLAINFHSGVDNHRVNSYDGLNLRIFRFNKFPG